MLRYVCHASHCQLKAGFETFFFSGRASPFTRFVAGKRCLAQQAQAKTQNDLFVPDCNADGSFKPIQCHVETGHCWCVDSEGKILAGSTVYNKQPNCKRFGECSLKEFSYRKSTTFATKTQQNRRRPVVTSGHESGWRLLVNRHSSSAAVGPLRCEERKGCRKIRLHELIPVAETERFGNSPRSPCFLFTLVSSLPCLPFFLTMAVGFRNRDDGLFTFF